MFNGLVFHKMYHTRGSFQKIIRYDGVIIVKRHHLEKYSVSENESEIVNGTNSGHTQTHISFFLHVLCSHTLLVF